MCVMILNKLAILNHLFTLFKTVILKTEIIEAFIKTFPTNRYHNIRDMDMRNVFLFDDPFNVKSIFTKCRLLKNNIRTANFIHLYKTYQTFKRQTVPEEACTNVSTFILYIIFTRILLRKY